MLNPLFCENVKIREHERERAGHERERAGRIKDGAQYAAASGENVACDHVVGPLVSGRAWRPAGLVSQ